MGSKVTQLEKALATRADDPRVMPGTHMGRKRKPIPMRYSDFQTCDMASLGCHECVCTHTNTVMYVYVVGGGD